MAHVKRYKQWLVIDRTILRKYFAKCKQLHIPRKNMFYAINQAAVQQLNLNPSIMNKVVFMKFIHQGNEYFTVLDRDLVHKINNIRWGCTSKNKKSGLYFPKYITANGHEDLHRVIKGASKGNVVHHRTDTYDNRYSRLREMTNANHSNLHSHRKWWTSNTEKITTDKELQTFINGL